MFKNKIGDYYENYTYLPGEMCIYRNCLWINNGTSSINNIAPVSSATNEGWKEIPCVLLTKEYTKKDTDNSSWMELQCNNYKSTRIRSK